MAKTKSESLCQHSHKQLSTHIHNNTIGNTQNKTATKETYTHLHLTKDTIDYTSKTKDLSRQYRRTFSPGLSQFKLRQLIQQKEIFDSQTSQFLLQSLAQCVSLISPYKTSSHYHIKPESHIQCPDLLQQSLLHHRLQADFSRPSSHFPNNCERV